MRRVEKIRTPVRLGPFARVDQKRAPGSYVDLVVVDVDLDVGLSGLLAIVEDEGWNPSAGQEICKYGQGGRLDRLQ